MKKDYLCRRLKNTLLSFVVANPKSASLILRTLFWNILLVFVFDVVQFLIFYGFFFIDLCIVSLFALSLSHSCTSLPTTATGWKTPIAINK